MAKRQVSKKKANEGRGVLCRNCYVRMDIQLNIDGGQDWLCPKCGLIWRAHGEES